jgi:hypothetical protein
MAVLNRIADREALQEINSEPAETNKYPQKHLIIAGTGRTGTSFLVRYLTQLGLDTTLARKGEGAGWDIEANAGLENMALGHGTEDLPYVIKSPWIGEYVDQILREKRFTIDAFVVPVRDLVEAATSRSVLEHRAIHQNNPWMADELDRSWETFGHTPGGVVYSLNPLDQARLLAVQFHQLVVKVSEAGIPLIFPAFPRIATDWERLHRCLEPILPAHITKEMACAAHARIADASKVRVTREIRNRDRCNVIYRSEAHAGPRYPSSAEIDCIALRREIGRIRQESSREIGRIREESSLQKAKLEEIIHGLHGKLRTKSIRNRIKKFVTILGGARVSEA